MITRILAALLGILHTGNGLFMVFGSRAWFDRVIGLNTGAAFNPHFVMDVGLAFFAAGVAFLLFAWRPAFQQLALGASGFVVLHAGLHVTGLLHGDLNALSLDLLRIVIPALLGLYLTLPRLELRHAH